jgi:apolipoprotein D and lipocalin family protein
MKIVKNKMSWSICMFLASYFGVGCSGTYLPLPTVSNVDLHKYMGKWYEIASFPNKFQKGCTCTTAEYDLQDDYVRVTNTCRKDSVNGKTDQAVGKAWVVDGSNNAKLKVSFFWPFKGDYWIIDLAADYSYAVVGNPARTYLWILCRTPRMDDATYAGIVKRVAEKGFDPSLLRRTEQACL